MTTATIARAGGAGTSDGTGPPSGHDRLPFQKKINLLSDRGLWPQLEALSKQHGWHSPEMRAFIDANLPKAPCPICGTPFYVYSRRVKYCSDRCRRTAAANNERERHERGEAPAASAGPRPVPPAPNGDLCVRLERPAPDVAEHRFYLLMVVQDLFGSVALVRRWGREERERSQQVVTKVGSLDQALELLEHFKAQCLKRGYRLVAVERGRIDPRTLG